MKSGALRGRMSRFPVLLVCGVAALGLGALAALIFVPGAAHAATLMSTDSTPLPTATLDPLMVPTTAVSSNAAPAGGGVSTSSSAIALAITLSCVTTIVGLIITVATYVGLVRAGYGPFLRALAPRWLRGRVRGKQSAARGERAPTLRYQPGPGDRQSGYDVYADERRGGRVAPSGRTRGGQAGRASSRSSSRSGRSRY